MNYIYVSKNVLNLVKEIVDIRSPSILLLKSSPSENLPPTPFKVLTFDKINLFPNLKNHSVILLNPEYIYPLSPLFDKKYSEILNILRKLKPKNIRVISSLVNYKGSRKLLKQAGANVDKFSFHFDLKFYIETVFTEEKSNELFKLTKNKTKTLIVCNNKNQMKTVYNLLSKNIPSILVWNKKEFEYRRRLVNLYMSGKFNLIVPKSFLNRELGIETNRIIYVSPSYSIPEYTRGILNYYTPNLETFILISKNDESKFLKRIKKKEELAREYIEFLNFCGFKGDKLNYLKNYFFSTETQAPSAKTFLSKNEERELVDTLDNEYFSFDEVSNILLGLNESYYFQKGFGIKKGLNIYLLENEINKLVSTKALGFRYFYDGENLVKKIY